MGLTSLQVCMDTSDWLQGTVHEEGGAVDHSASPPGEMSITCTRPPLLERRLRPQHDQALKCPRCDSTHTKFCYYNNYSLSQPRYFCKTCRRYWTKGGSLRNVPVGGGCRKNKKVAAAAAGSKKPLNEHEFPPSHQVLAGSSSSSPHDGTDLHLSFSHQLHMTSLLGNPNPMDIHQCKYDQHADHLLGNHNYPRQAADLFSSSSTHDHHHVNKFDALFGNYPGRSSYANFMGAANAGGLVLGSDNMSSPINNGFSSGTTTSSSLHGFYSPLGFSLDHNASVHGTSAAAFMDGGSERTLMMPFGGAEEEPMTPIDMKPNPKQLLSLEWHEVQAPHCSEVGKDSFGFLMNAPGSSWSGMMNGYGSSSTTNPLV